jgi:hypothetical protein
MLFAGIVHHVQGRQIREHRGGHQALHMGHHHHGIHSIPNVANPHQYTSYEEFQKAMENPFENNTSVNLTVRECYGFENSFALKVFFNLYFFVCVQVPLGDVAYLR